MKYTVILSYADIDEGPRMRVEHVRATSTAEAAAEAFRLYSTGSGCFDDVVVFTGTRNDIGPGWRYCRGAE